MHIVVFNTGSSSLKFGLYEAATVNELGQGVIERIGLRGGARLRWRSAAGGKEDRELEVGTHGEAVRESLRVLAVLSPLGGIAAAGHRVVHGGTAFRQSVRIDGRVKSAIASLAELAPLHNPPALAAIEAAESELPAAAQVAVFDTAFFADLPRPACVYPLPYEWHTAWGVRRYGFHGISHRYCTERAAGMIHGARLVVCHLGNGCSASAVRNGTPVATTMGFTPLDGLMMGTRPGSLDPGILIHLLRTKRLDLDQLDDALNHQSGLLGVSGVSSDYRQVEAAADRGDDRARLALDQYAAIIRSTIGGLAVTLRGLDALVFTAGVGENSARLRASVCEGLECLGVSVDRDKNEVCEPDTDIARSSSSVRILVLRTREELAIAREARKLIATP